MRRPSQPHERRAAVIQLPSMPAVERRNVLDRAHRGDIEGALGRIRAFDASWPRTPGQRLRALLAVMGPGLLVMAADNDAGSVSTFAQAGQDYGLRWVWILVPLGVALYVVQEMVGRLGAVTGTGHARLIFERFGRRWGAFALGDLVVLNLLLIVTEFIGLQLGLAYFGVSRFVSVPVAAVALVGLTATGSFRRWERAMLLLVVCNLAALPLLALTHLDRHGAGPVVGGQPAVPGAALLFGLAIVGTTVAPWQLFFQQSSVVDKRITTPWLRYERAETAGGVVLFAVGATAILVACAAAFGGTVWHGRFVNAGAVADVLRHIAGPWAGALFALALIDGSILGAAVVTLSTAYAVGDVTGVRHSLHRRWGEAPTFYGVYAGCVGAAATVVLLAAHSLGVVTLAVQALSGVLFPSAAVFLLLLCNDRAVLGPWVNPRWLNVVAVTLVAVLLVLSALLTVSTVFPQVSLTWPAAVMGSIALVAVVAVAGTSRPRRPAGEDRPGLDWQGPAWTWTMPSLESVPAPLPSRARIVGLVVLRIYLGLTVVALSIRVARILLG